MLDKDDAVTAIAAAIYTSRKGATAEKAVPIEAVAEEAWDLYYQLHRAVLECPRRQTGSSFRGNVRYGERKQS